MCEAMQGIIEDSEKRGALSVCVQMISKGILTVQQAADSLNMSVANFRKQSKAYGFNLEK